MELKHYPTLIVTQISGVTEGQIKHWVRTGLIRPTRRGERNFYSFRDIVEIKVIGKLRRQGVSLQKIRKSINYLRRALPDRAHVDILSSLEIHTDGNDIYVYEKGRYFNTSNGQTYFCFDTENVRGELVRLEKSLPKLRVISLRKSA